MHTVLLEGSIALSDEGTWMSKVLFRVVGLFLKMPETALARWPINVLLAIAF